MMISSMEDLLASVISARTPNDVRALLADIGDTPDIEIDQEFGRLGLRWHPYGSNLSNISSIGLGTKPGRSLTERLTNAIDAVLVARNPLTGTMPDSSRAAAKQWFGRPVSGPEEGLYRWRYSDGDYDKQIHVVLHGSGIESAPTVDVLDYGCGIAPEDFGNTILSLQSGNKINKKYLIGAFGQGGASTLAFGDYTIVISRSKQNPKEVGFTVIRVLRLGDQYKEDAYAYLALPGIGKEVEVPSVMVDGELALYEASGNLKAVPALGHGTLVRHVAYKLPGVSGKLGPDVGNLYHYLHASMVDPLLPFRLLDLRSSEKARDEVVTGSRNRLMARWARQQKKQQDAKNEDAEGEAEEGRIHIAHHRPMEYIAPHGGARPSVGIEYWVVLAYRKGKKGTEEQVLRPASSHLFAMPNHPIVGSMNGQNQGERTGKLLKDIGLGMVSKHIVIHIDASEVDTRVRRELFSSNREGFKDGDVLEALLRGLEQMLRDDEDLFRIERELEEGLTRRDSEATSKEVKDQISKLLLEAGYTTTEEGPASVPGTGDAAVVRERRRRPYSRLEPLPTLPYPDVTRLVIVSPTPAMSVHLGDSELLLAETDADAQYDREDRISLRIEPPILEQAAKAPLRGGRVRWRLRPLADANAGSKGLIIVTITRPNGTQLTADLSFEVLAAKEQKAKSGKGMVPPFEVFPVDPTMNEWLELWPSLGEESSSEELSAVAYKQRTAGGKIFVYYSTIFEPYTQMVDKLKRETSSVAPLFETNYKVWVGYHGILQENAKADFPESIDDEEAEQLMEEDRIRVARMQVKQALVLANLQQKLSKREAEGE